MITYRSRQNKLYKWRKANGVASTVPAEPIREHIESLYALGLTMAMIGHAADCTGQNIRFITDGTAKIVRVDLAERIMAVTHHPDPRQHFVLPTGALRRLRALNALGWPSSDIADRIGISHDRLNASIASPRIPYTRWEEIRRIYDELSGTPGPSAKSIQVARRNGHPPPLAWEGVDIDDPRAQPDWIAAGIKRHERPVCVNNHPRAQNEYYDSRGRQCRACIAGQRARRAAREKANAA